MSGIPRHYPNSYRAFATISDEGGFEALTPTKPTPALGGRQSFEGDIQTALDATDAAADALRSMMPHGRDYATTELLNHARWQHRQRIDRLKGTSLELQLVLMLSRGEVE